MYTVYRGFVQFSPVSRVNDAVMVSILGFKKKARPIGKIAEEPKIYGKYLQTWEELRNFAHSKP